MLIFLFTDPASKPEDGYVYCIRNTACKVKMIFIRLVGLVLLFNVFNVYLKHILLNLLWTKTQVW